MYTKVVLGGPGTGKTTRNLAILREELENTPAEKIAYVSYTRQGTYQGVSLAKEQFDLSEEQCKYFRTLHSLCFRLTESSKEEMLDFKDMKYFSEHVGIENVAEILKFEDMQRNNPHVAAILYETLSLDPYAVQYVCKNYKSYKQYHKKKDFTDLLEQVLESKMVLPIDVAIVDEAQDLTTLQWKVVRSLFRDVKRFYVAGDPNQSIYDWAGADYKYFMHMEADEVEVLDTTYRLPRKIWELGRKVHAMIDESTPYPSKCKDEEGVLKQIASLENLKIRANESYLFLARANYSLSGVEEFLRMEGHLYIDTDGALSVSKKKLAFLRAFFMFMHKDRKSSVLTKFFTPAQLMEMRELKNYEEVFMTVIDWEDKEYCFSIGANKHYEDDPYKIRIASMHRVKGAEADNVYVLLDATKKTVMRFQDDPDAELRVLYVALTRAIHRLYIVSSSTKYSYPITEIGQGVVE